MHSLGIYVDGVLLKGAAPMRSILKGAEYFVEYGSGASTEHYAPLAKFTVPELSLRALSHIFDVYKCVHPLSLVLRP